MIARRHFLAGTAASTAILPFAQGARAETVTLLNVSYDPTRELYTELNDGFAKSYKKEAGVDVKIEQSHGGSSKQARSVIDGLKADVVTLALAWDITALERAGLVKAEWQQKLPENASPYTSTIAFLVRKGNPKGIKTWTDLTREGVEVVTANPKTSGGARWAFLAVWGAAAKEFPALSNAEAKAAVGAFYNAHVPVLDTGARGATVSFAQKGIGDVLLNWENELWLTKEEFGADKFDIVYPPISILCEPPVAVVDSVVDAKGTRAVAEAYLKYLYTPEAQDVIGQLHYRPRDIDALKRYSAELPTFPLFTVDESFGGWTKTHQAFFADGALFDQIYKPK